jgi:hypothetical protein
MDALSILKAFNLCFLFASFLSLLQGAILYINTFFNGNLSIYNVDFPPIRLIIFVILIMISLVLAENIVGPMEQDKLLSSSPFWIRLLFRGALIAGLIHAVLCALTGFLSANGSTELWYLRVALGSSITLHIYMAIFFYAILCVRKAI